MSSPNLENDIIPKIANKFNKDEIWAKNLYEWHKDSSPLTKNEDGTPKVFYHATNADEKFEIFDKNKIHSGYGFWFGDNINNQAVREAKTGKAPIFKVFLQMKKPFVVLEPINKNNYKEFEKIYKRKFEREMRNNEKLAEFENFVKEKLQADEVDIGVVNFSWSIKKNGKWKTYNGKDLEKILTPELRNEAQKYLDNVIIRKIYNNDLPRAYGANPQDAKEANEIKQRLIKNGYDSIVYGDEFVVFDSNQIKSIDNTGKFDGINPNILQANQHLVAGLAGGSLNGIETDEDGNIIGFSPSKFVAGFLGGAGVSKATQFALKNPKFRAKADKFLQQSGDFIVNELKNPNLPVQTRQTLERIFGKALVRQMDARAFIIAGENAIGANKAKLSKAQVMQKAGKSDDEIWLKTGWYYDKDGKWKFEINPAGGEFKQDFDKISHIEYNSEGVGYEIRFNGVLSDYLDDKELFKAYPQLKEFKIVVGDIGNPQWLAEYNNKNKIFYLNTNAISKENAKSVLYHEIQHAVQDLEGFASGGNPKTALSYADETQKQKIANYKKSFAGKDLDDDAIAYKFLHGEVEARNVENRMKNMDDLKMLNEPEKAAWLEPDEIKYAHAKTKMHPYETQDIKDSIVSFHNDKDEYGRE